MYKVWIISDNGKGYVNSMSFKELDDIQIYTANIGSNCLIKIEEIESEKK